ncbi:hypothetical protein K435DRAFT_818804 [Dendrothele bispora CBS 962.96]|uniref:Uncharacterized protein n=1 Tax=Dendrothele bispora (strain CBS 962.96) TaxID=1314807 RepID=A0A4S8M8C3_DENBC|nr:hypothetical protein K435DRAFT_818804 [Dendrothele bispora CBS 962.96]
MSDSLIESTEFAMSQVSLHSNSSQSEDWDRSLIMDDSASSSQSSDAKTPRNSVAFPADANGKDMDETPSAPGGGKGNRSLSELMKLHAEKGTDCNFSSEEAARIADVLGRWINASSSPYEDDDDFFAKTSQDDISLNASTRTGVTDGRPRGQSESVGSRPGSTKP